MLVRVLGTVELVAGGDAVVSLPGTRQPALLAALAARANEVVSTDRLVTLLWGDDLPENPEASLHSTVFKLRASLRDAGGRDVLLTRERGYQLALRPGDLDADRGVVEARRDPQMAFAGHALHRLLGVDEQVGEHLVELVAVAPDRRQRRRKPSASDGTSRSPTLSPRPAR